MKIPNRLIYAVGVFFVQGRLANALRLFEETNDEPQGVGLVQERLREVHMIYRFVHAELFLDLDEAHEIAERCSMKLHLADIHLHRARLFRNKEELKRARALIKQCGYGRRKDELEDAEESAKSW